MSNLCTIHVNIANRAANIRTFPAILNLQQWFVDMYGFRHFGLVLYTIEVSNTLFKVRQ